MCHWLSCSDFALKRLLNRAAEVDLNFLSPALFDAVRQVIIGQLRSHIADIVS